MNKKFDIIPAIDVIDKKVVRLTKGDYNKKTFYEKSILEVAKYLENIGIKNLHLVDLIGAKNGKIQELEIVKEILEKTNLDIDFGGGIRDESEIKKLLDSGIKYINIGSLAVKNKKLMSEFIKKFKAENFSIGIDVIGDYCYINGWETKSEFTYKKILNFYGKLGVKRFNITSIENDGMLSGIDLEFYKKIILEFPNLEIIASGGVKDNQDIIKAKKIGCAGIIIGKAFYEGKIDLENLI